MKEKGLSQEGLKAIACGTMLLDHIGAALVPWEILRVIGRIAFPIFCFLLAEGAARSRNPARYAARLMLAALLSELPFDLLFFRRVTPADQNVMVTLLLGLVMAFCLMRTDSGWVQAAAVAGFALLANYWNTDYGGWGVVLIALFVLARGKPQARLTQLLGMTVIFYAMNSYPLTVAGLRIPIEMFALLAMVPISLYHGKKRTQSPAVRFGFYCFYPVHLTLLLLIRLAIFGA